MYYIYKTTCLVNGKIYVGKHKCDSNSIDKNYLGSGKLLWQAIAKYGKENFIQEIIEFNDSEEENCLRERFWISKLQSQDRNIGYNISPGGEGGISHFNSETNKWLAIETWKNYSEQERAERIKKMQDGLHRPESLKKVSEKAKQWHANMTEEEKSAWKEKCSKGWTEDQKSRAAKRLAKRNSEETVWDRMVKKYGDNAQEHYDLWRKKLSEKSKANVEGQKKRLATIALQRESPDYKEWKHLLAAAQSLKKKFKQGKIDEDSFNEEFESINNRIQELKLRVQEFVNERNNG